jgi:hypothetical protein
MKRFSIRLSICLCLALFVVKSPLHAAEPTGSIQVTVTYQKMTYQTTWYFVFLFHTDWSPIDGILQTPFGPMGGGTVLIENVPPGDYYVKFSVWLEDCRAGSSEYHPCNDPYIPEYYNNSLTKGGATMIHVAASETTVLNPVWLETGYFICLTTSPNAFPVEMDGLRRTAPMFLAWRAGETRRIGADEFIDWPNGGRYFFSYWKDGGPRIQDYTVPAGTKKDTLVARYVFKMPLTVVSDHGNPRGAGWHKTWDDTLVEVEQTVVEKIPPHAFPSMIMAHADTDSVKYEFDRWEGTGDGSYSGTDNPATVVMNGVIREKAFWKTQFRLVVQIPDTSMGTVNVDPPGLWQEKGDTVYLTAQSRPGFAFSGWEGSLDGTAATDSVVMDSTKTVAARFAVSLHPPVIAVPDTGWAEDDTLFLAKSEFSRWIEDPVDPLETLTMRLESFLGLIHSRLDSDGVRFWSDPDWNGYAWEVIEVSDPSGSSAADTVRLTVTAVDDPPGPFDLVSPPGGYVIGDSLEALPFIWRTSRNRDAAYGDTIRYAFCFGKEGADLDTLSLKADTSFAWAFSDVPDNGEYQWKVLALDKALNAEWSASERKLTVSIQSGVKDGKRMPTEYGLSRNYPNPFNPSTEIGYSLPERGRVRIEVYDPTGRKIRTLVDRDMPAGEYTVVWDGANDAGRRVGSGIYVCRMTAGRFTKSIKMTVMK